MNKKMKIRNTGLLLLTSIIWGMAFVAQSVSMDYIGPMTFIFLRSVLGSMVLFPFILLRDRKAERAGPLPYEEGWKNRGLYRGGAVCGVFLFLASCFQQNGIRFTTVGKAGFITTFYIIIIPIIGIFMKKHCGILTWIAVFVALTGLYFLCINEEMHFQFGDFLVLVCAFMFSGQVLAVAHYTLHMDSVKLSLVQFMVCGALAFIAMLLTEKPDPVMIRAAALPVLYTGIMSTGVAYTLQTVGQKGLNPTAAALIFSLESVFSALAGFVFLHQILSPRELLGCALMFFAIILAQLPEPFSACRSIDTC